MRSSESVSFIAKTALVASTLIGPQACSMRDPDDVKKIETLESEIAAKAKVNETCADLEGKLRDCIGVVHKCKLNEIEGESLKEGAIELLNVVDGALNEGTVDSLDICNANLEICRLISDSHKNAYETCMSDVHDTINKLARPSGK